MKQLIFFVIIITALFFQKSYGQDSLQIMSDGSTRIVVKPVQSFPLYDREVYEKYGEKNYIASFQSKLFFEKEFVISYNTFLTEKTKQEFIPSLYQGKEKLTKSGPPILITSYKWIYVLLIALCIGLIVNMKPVERYIFLLTGIISFIYGIFLCFFPILWWILVLVELGLIYFLYEGIVEIKIRDFLELFLRYIVVNLIISFGIAFADLGCCLFQSQLSLLSFGYIVLSLSLSGSIGYIIWNYRKKQPITLFE